MAHIMHRAIVHIMHCSMVHIIKFGGKRELSHIETDMRHRQTSNRQTNKQTNRATDQSLMERGSIGKPDKDLLQSPSLNQTGDGKTCANKSMMHFHIVEKVV